MYLIKAVNKSQRVSFRVTGRRIRDIQAALVAKGVSKKAARDVRATRDTASDGWKFYHVEGPKAPAPSAFRPPAVNRVATPSAPSATASPKDIKVRAGDRSIGAISSGNPYADLFIARTYVDTGIPASDLVSMWRAVMEDAVEAAPAKRPLTLKGMTAALHAVDTAMTARYGGSGNAGWFGSWFEAGRTYKTGAYNYMARFLRGADKTCNCVCGTNMLYAAAFELGWTKELHGNKFAPRITAAARDGHVAIGIAFGVSLLRYETTVAHKKASGSSRDAVGYMIGDGGYLLTRTVKGSRDDAAKLRVLPRSVSKIAGLGLVESLRTGTLDTESVERLAVRSLQASPEEALGLGETLKVLMKGRRKWADAGSAPNADEALAEYTRRRDENELVYVARSRKRQSAAGSPAPCKGPDQ